MATWKIRAKIIAWVKLGLNQLKCYTPVQRCTRSQLMHSSHRPPDKTRQSCLCRVWCGGVNWTKLLLTRSEFNFSVGRRQSWVVCRESCSHRRSGRDTDKTVLSASCLAWRCELALMNTRWRVVRGKARESTGSKRSSTAMGTLSRCPRSVRLRCPQTRNYSVQRELHHGCKNVF